MRPAHVTGLGYKARKGEFKFLYGPRADHGNRQFEVGQIIMRSRDGRRCFDAL